MKCSTINNISFKAVYYENGGTPDQQQKMERIKNKITPEHVERMEKLGYDFVVSNGCGDMVEIGIVPQIRQQESFLKYNQNSEFEPNEFCDNIEKTESFENKVINIVSGISNAIGVVGFLAFVYLLFSSCNTKTASVADKAKTEILHKMK